MTLRSGFNMGFALGHRFGRWLGGLVNVRAWLVGLACGAAAWVAMVVADDDVAFLIGFGCAAALAKLAHWEMNR